MPNSINKFSLLVLSSLLLLARLTEGLVVPEVGRFNNLAKKDISGSVTRSSLVKRDGARGLVQPSDDGLYYYTNVSFGTPPQPLTLALSLEGTTWAPTLPAGNTIKGFCSESHNKVACSYAEISGFYTIPGSVTYSPQGDFQTLNVGAKETITGMRALELVELGSVNLANVAIAVAQSWNSPPQLSLSTIQDTKTSGPQLLSVLKQANIVNTLAYSLSFANVDQSGTTDYKSGELAFGGIDESQFFGELGTFDATSGAPTGTVPVTDIHWIDSNGKNASLVSEDSKAGHLGLGQVAFTPYLWLHDTMFQIVASLFNDVQKDNASGLYTANCTGSLDVNALQMSIDGILITLPMDRLLFDKSTCTLAIRPMSEYATKTSAEYILGFPFLQSAYTVFDFTNSQTHVAPRRLVHSPSAPTITPVGENGEKISGSGAPVTASISPVFTTLSKPREDGQLQPAPTQAPTPTESHPTSPPAASTPVQTQRFYDNPSADSNIAAIVGGVVGGVILLAVVIVFYPLFKSYKKRRMWRKELERQRAMHLPRSGASSSNELGHIDTCGDGGDGDIGDDDDEKDADMLAMAIEESKKMAIAGPLSKLEPVVLRRESVGIGVAVTEVSSNYSSPVERNSYSGKTFINFDENDDETTNN
ncbi:Barrierpepsin [Arthrobotrys entomopaga]|nr:Barrierpepsin [Arthrobotrys entomopaga]